jgi:hypothetical protein
MTELIRKEMSDDKRNSLRELFQGERGIFGSFDAFIDGGTFELISVDDFGESTEIATGLSERLVDNVDIIYRISKDVITQEFKYIYLQDIWALNGDYDLKRPKYSKIVELDDSIYARYVAGTISDFFDETLRNLISNSAVYLYTTMELERSIPLREFDQIVAAAIQIFDNQGWLVWVRN